MPPLQRRAHPLEKWNRFSAAMTLPGGVPLIEQIRVDQATVEYVCSGNPDASWHRDSSRPPPGELSARATAVGTLYDHYVDTVQHGKRRSKGAYPSHVLGKEEVLGAMRDVPEDDLTKELLAAIADSSLYRATKVAAQRLLQSFNQE